MPDDRTAKLLADLDAGVAQLRTSEEWENLLRFQAKFHNYSPANAMLILMQRPTASRVAGYRKWEEVGRHVVKGEKALWILAPLITKVVDEATGDKVDKVFGFRGACVFDVSQTEGAELPSPVRKLEGEAPEGLRAHLERFIRDQGFTLSFEPLEGTTNGYTRFSDKVVVVSSALSSVMTCKTLAHEAGHMLLHEKDAPERAVAELEAESVAFIVMAMAGVDSACYSFGYLANWTGEATGEAIRQSAERIGKAARKLAPPEEAAQRAQIAA